MIKIGGTTGPSISTIFEANPSLASNLKVVKESTRSGKKANEKATEKQSIVPDFCEFVNRRVDEVSGLYREFGEWCKMSSGVLDIAPVRRSEPAAQFLLRTWNSGVLKKAIATGRQGSHRAVVASFLCAFLRAQVRALRLDTTQDGHDIPSIVVRQTFADVIEKSRFFPKNPPAQTSRFEWGDGIVASTIDVSEYDGFDIDKVLLTSRNRSELVALKRGVRAYFMKSPLLKDEWGNMSTRAWSILEPALVVSAPYGEGSISSTTNPHNYVFVWYRMFSESDGTPLDLPWTTRSLSEAR